jgi:hypothetical protein
MSYTIDDSSKDRIASELEWERKFQRSVEGEKLA